ncbi:hypothetical protein BCR44DRAFT_1466213, partial [Catenaria anguillulae PL171]
MRDNGGPAPKAPKAANDGFTLVTRRTIRCPALRPGPDNGRVILGNNENDKYLVKVPKHKIVNGATGIVMKMLADAMDMQRIPYRDLRKCPGQIGDFVKFTFSLAVMPPDTIEVKGLGVMRIEKHGWDEVDGEKRQFVGFAGPLSRGASLGEVREFLSKQWGELQVEGSIDILGSKYTKVRFPSKTAMEAAGNDAPMFFRRQYTSLYASLEDFRAKVKDKDLTLQVVVHKDAVNQIAFIEFDGLGGGRAIAVENNRLREFSIVLWQAGNKEVREAMLQDGGRLVINGARAQVYPASIKLCFSCGEPDHTQTQCAARKEWKEREEAQKQQAAQRHGASPGRARVVNGQSYASAAGGGSTGRVAAGQEEDRRVAELEAENAALRKENEQLKSTIGKLEATVEGLKGSERRVDAQMQEQNQLIGSLLSVVESLAKGDNGAAMEAAVAIRKNMEATAQGQEDGGDEMEVDQEPVARRRPQTRPHEDVS